MLPTATVHVELDIDSTLCETLRVRNQLMLNMLHKSQVELIGAHLNQGSQVDSLAEKSSSLRPTRPVWPGRCTFCANSFFNFPTWFSKKQPTNRLRKLRWSRPVGLGHVLCMAGRLRCLGHGPGLRHVRHGPRLQICLNPRAWLLSTWVKTC